MKDAHAVLSSMGITSKSAKRERRPCELDLIMRHFVEMQARAPRSTPMHMIVPFALFSTRRQEEITRISWADLDEEHSRVLVRDMKNPGQKIGNDVWVDLPLEALAIVKTMPRNDARIFSYSTDAISAAFTRACLILGITTDRMPDEKRLHFHDLRHEGISRLFEMGRSIPQVATVSGHRSWQSLQRYSHVRASGDKYAGWKWLADVSQKAKDANAMTTDSSSTKEKED
jgi:integrase